MSYWLVKHGRKYLVVTPEGGPSWSTKREKAFQFVDRKTAIQFACVAVPGSGRFELIEETEEEG